MDGDGWMYWDDAWEYEYWVDSDWWWESECV